MVRKLGDLSGETGKTSEKAEVMDELGGMVGE